MNILGLISQLIGIKTLRLTPIVQVLQPKFSLEFNLGFIVIHLNN